MEYVFWSQDHTTRPGDHIVFHCPAHTRPGALLRPATKWEDLDRPIWVQDGGNEDPWGRSEGVFFRRVLFLFPPSRLATSLFSLPGFNTIDFLTFSLSI